MRKKNPATMARGIDKINKFRSLMGLRALNYGYVECLSCPKEFWSEDKSTLRICLNCSTRDRSSEGEALCLSLPMEES